MIMEDKDKLKSLFQEMKLDEPSATFESRLMEHIYIAEKKKNRLKNIKSYAAVTGGIIGILGIPSLILWILSLVNKTAFPIMKTDFNVPIPQLQIDPFIIVIASVTLLLLVADTLIRRHLREKKEKE